MTRKDVNKGRTQGAIDMSLATQQLMLPLLLAMDATKQGLLTFVQQVGFVVLSELLASEAQMLAGPKGKHMPNRTHRHWARRRLQLRLELPFR